MHLGPILGKPHAQTGEFGKGLTAFFWLGDVSLNRRKYLLLNLIRRSPSRVQEFEACDLAPAGISSQLHAPNIPKNQNNCHNRSNRYIFPYRYDRDNR
ncbi:MAG: hypothetical protein CMJ78_15065 [Planctomycetaceae bacterium]|nr:hypothetical protein [Planctomycetaceae bacterium]